MSEPQVSRRGVVAGGGAALALAGSTGLAGSASAAAAPPVRVGVLTPAGTSIATSGRSLVAGLGLGFARSGLAATLDRRDVTYGYLGAADAARDVVASGARVVVAGVSAHAARRVAEVCSDAGVGLVVAQVGAHLVDEPIDGAVVNSLQHWQCALRAGEWARSLGRTLFAIVAAPDAGYDSVFAVRRGFVSAGGRYAGFALTHDAASGTGVTTAVRAAKRSGADVVVVNASGSRAVEILKAVRAVGLRAEVVVDALVLEPSVVRAVGSAARGVHSVASWTTGTSAGRAFEQAHRRSTGRRPDAFAALGHDTAVLVAEGARRLGPVADWSRLARVLAGRRVTGVRGVQVVDRRLRTVSTPLAVRRTDATGTTTVRASRPPVRGVPATMTVLDPDRVAAYVNEYLGT